jgi:hypothetical protein
LALPRLKLKVLDVAGNQGVGTAAGSKFIWVQLPCARLLPSAIDYCRSHPLSWDDFPLPDSSGHPELGIALGSLLQVVKWNPNAMKLEV